MEKKAEVLYESAINVVEDVFDNPRSGETIKRSRELIGHSVDFILSGPKAYINLLKIRRHDYYTFTHSVNVCTFLISLAQSLGIDDRKTLFEIGEGGLLHDLGKSRIPSSIINKQGQLTSSEWEIMRQHPQLGVQIALETRDIAPISVTIIGQHHERRTGKGYPAGLKGMELDLYANMASIVDVYDAITTTRSYSQARSAIDAAKFLLSIREDFNEDILKRFIVILAVA
jgi:putative nucleotidyltransferase with HDIG domain